MENIKEELLAIAKLLLDEGVVSASIDNFYRISGGSVNHTFGLITKREKLFLKLNYKKNFPEMFQKERLGLQLLKSASTLRIPKVKFLGETINCSFLVLELIEENSKGKCYWENFGRGLAEVHSNKNKEFGLSYSNYNGSLIQKNVWKDNWCEFFLENRLEFQLKLAVENKRVDQEFVHLFTKAILTIKDIFPVEEPALLHGDLWSGNFITDENGDPVLIDPAVYYGHREADIAMSMLFGGFNKRFYEAYQNEFPLEKGWEKRVDVFNLYPLLVHVNLFGPSYAQRVKGILKRLV